MSCVWGSSGFHKVTWVDDCWGRWSQLGQCRVIPMIEFGYRWWQWLRLLFNQNWRRRKNIWGQNKHERLGPQPVGHCSKKVIKMLWTIRCKTFFAQIRKDGWGSLFSSRQKGSQDWGILSSSLTYIPFSFMISSKLVEIISRLYRIWATKLNYQDMDMVIKWSVLFSYKCFCWINLSSHIFFSI